MPLEALRAGLDWQWSSFGDWLQRLDGRQQSMPVSWWDIRRFDWRRWATTPSAATRPRSRSRRWPRCLVPRWRTVRWACRRRSRTPTTTAKASRCRRAARHARNWWRLLPRSARIRHPARGDHPRPPVGLHRRRHLAAHRHVEGRRSAAELERARRLRRKSRRPRKAVACIRSRRGTRWPHRRAHTAALHEDPAVVPRPASCSTGCRAGERRCTCQWPSRCGRLPI